MFSGDKPMNLQDQQKQQAAEGQDAINDNNNPVRQPQGRLPGNKPSDDNQRHSNKVESIEVLINKFNKNEKDNKDAMQAIHDQQVDKIELEEQVRASAGLQYAPSLAEVSGIPQQIDRGHQNDQAGHHYSNMVDPQMSGLDSYKHFVPETGAYDSGHHQQHHHHHHQMHQEINIDEEVFSEGGFIPEDALSIQLFKEGEPGNEDRVMAADGGQNDKRFYTLSELAEMEPMFERCQVGRDQVAHNAHVLLSPQEYRAKLYWLDTENRWKDIGTGRFRLLLSKDQEEHYIQVVSEDCMEDQMALGDDIDKAMEGIAPSQTDNAQSPQDQNQGGHHINSPSKQVFLHRCFVQCLQDFSRQGDTIITWQDDYKNEFALSFQDEKGAQNTWWSICFLKGIQINSNIDEQNEAGGSSETNSLTNCGLVLPTKENLADQANDLFSTDAYARRNLAEAVLKQQITPDQNAQKAQNNCASSELSERDHMKLQSWRSIYLDKLQKIFNEVEQSYHKATKAMEENEGDEHDRCIHLTQQVNHLHSLFQIFRNLLNLNQNELLEVLLNENYWMTTFGALEYDPEVFCPFGYKYDNQSGARSPTNIKQPSMAGSLNSSPNSNARSYGNYDHYEQNQQFSAMLTQEADFREFLSDKVQFKQAVDINDPQVIYSIHLSYKLQYLKDTAMARFIDESTSHTIMQLVSSLHQIILDYIFGDEFERIQQELIAKMRDNNNVQDKENALKFFLEICSLLKSINLTNRQLQTCNNAFTKIMIVLAQIFDIMIPDRQTLLAEMKQDKEGLIKIFEDRSIRDLSKTQVKQEVQQQNEEANQQVTDQINQLQQQHQSPQGIQGGSILKAKGDEANDKKQWDAADDEPQMLEGEDKNSSHDDQFDNPLANQTPDDLSILQRQDFDTIINPGRETVQQYLKNPVNSEDPNMTQIDTLKSNSIEIFYNLLILLNNVNHSTIRDFLCSDQQKKQNYVFLRHLAQHMMYTSQQGIKVSICEFFKDLTSKETSSEMQKTFQIVIQKHVVSQFVEFIWNECLEEEKERQKLAKNGGGQEDEEMKSEGQKSHEPLESKQQIAFNKQIDQSRILILQFLNKLIIENVDSYQLRMFFMQEKVLLKVAENLNCTSIQTHVEVIKFFKAIIQTKDNMSMNFMIKKQIFDRILELFLANRTKGNLLHSCILNLFDMLTPAEIQPASNANMLMGMDNGYGGPKTEGGYVQTNLLNKLYQKLQESGFVKRVFFNKKYEDGFKKFNRSLRQMLDLPQSEQNSKQQSDIDVSSSQNQNYHDHANFNEMGRAGNNQMAQQDVGSYRVHGLADHSMDADTGYEGVDQKFTSGQYGLQAQGKTSSSPIINEGINSDEDDLAQYDFNAQQQIGHQDAEDPNAKASKKASQAAALLKHAQALAVNDPHVPDEVLAGCKPGDMVDAMAQGQLSFQNQAEQMQQDSGFGANEERKIAPVVSPIQHQSQNRADGEDGERDGGSDEFIKDLIAENTYKDELIDSKDPKKPAGNKMMDIIAQYQQRVPTKQDTENRRLSMSPISGHDDAVPLISQEPLRKGLSGTLKSSPEIDQQPHRLRQRRRSQENFAIQHQNSGNSAKILNMSDEANGSNKGGKSAFSDTISNPDLDEIFFNHSGGPRGFNFQIGPPTQSQPNTNNLRRQDSPIDLESAGIDIGQSPSNNNPNILPKPHSKRKSKEHKPKFERGRRACSENPPARTELVKLTINKQESGDQDDNNVEAAAPGNSQEQELERILDAKLLAAAPLDKISQTPKLKRRSHLLAMNRGESICELIPDVKVGQKRPRQEDDQLQLVENMVKDTWAAKRPKLTSEDLDAPNQGFNKANAANQQQNLENQAMEQQQDEVVQNPSASDVQQEDQDLQTLLDASLKQGQPEKQN